MAKPLTRAQAAENRAFLKALRRTGNVRLACRELGLKYGTMQDRRKKHPAFALRWDAALVFAQARFEAVGRVGPSVGRPRCSPLRPFAYKKGEKGRHGSESGTPLTLPSPHSRGRVPPSPAAARGEGLFRTNGGEPVLRRTRNGKLQLQRAHAGRLTREAGQAFLAAVSATCNLSLAAAAVGASFGAFNKRRRTDPAFARELRLALAEGWRGLEMGLLESGMPGSHQHSDWRHNDPPAMPPMSVNQALQLLYLHQKAAMMLDEPDYLKRRRGESRAAHSERLTAMAEERDRRAREAFEAAEAERWASFDTGLRRSSAPTQDERSRLGLPDLSPVTGWSRADPTKEAHRADTALFGGWRMEEMAAKRRG